MSCVSKVQISFLGLIPLLLLATGCAGSTEQDESGAEAVDSTSSELTDTNLAKALGQASGDGIPSHARAIMQAQLPMKEAARIIRTAVEQGDASGFAGIALESDAVAVWWKGEVPSSIQAAIAQAKLKFNVALRQAPYSRAELRDEAEVLAQSMRANRQGKMHSVRIPVDGSGLIVVSDPEAPVPPILKERSKVGHIPTSHIHEPRVVPTSRLVDVPPYWGGARIIRDLPNNYIGLCTSGFGVIDGNSSRYLLTAGHCGEVGTAFYNGNHSRLIGTASIKNKSHDIMLIPASVGNRIYDGGVGTGEFSKIVTGWDFVYAGEYLCGSGATSGVICGAHATTTVNFWYCDAENNCFYDLVVADMGTSNFAGGDSGGPIFSLAANNGVWAKGILSGVGANFFVFQDMGTAFNDFHVMTL